MTMSNLANEYRVNAMDVHSLIELMEISLDKHAQRAEKAGVLLNQAPHTQHLKKVRTLIMNCLTELSGMAPEEIEKALEKLQK